MRIPIKFAELHMVLFMNGNLGTKISPKNKTGIVMEWDTDHRWLVVQYNGMVSLIPEATVASMQPESPKDIGYETFKSVLPTNFAPPARSIETAPLTGKINAQVSDPAKPVKGLTGLEGAPKFKPHTPKPAKTVEPTPVPLTDKVDKGESH